MRTRYQVRLTDDERQQLTTLTRRGQTAARRLTRARILLLADAGATDRAIAAALGIHPRTCERVRQRAVLAGVRSAIEERPRPGKQRLLDGRQEAHLIALACSDPPSGRTSWTMQLLADRLVELEIVDAISDETVRRTLKKTTCSPGASSSGASPPSTPPTSAAWRTSSTSTPPRLILGGRWSASTSCPTG